MQTGSALVKIMLNSNFIEQLDGAGLWACSIFN